jgi:hypothetical protein
MFKKQHVIPFLIGWLIVGWILPPSKVLGMLGGKKAA